MSQPARPGLDPPGRLLPLYPMTVADVLDGAFRTWRAVVGPAALAVVLVTAPVELISNLLLFRRAPDLLAGTMMAEPTFFDLGTAGMLVLFSLVGMVVSVYVATVVVTIAVDADRGRPAVIGTALRAALRPTGSALVSLLLVGLTASAALIGAVVIALVPFIGAFVLLFAGPVAIGAVAAVAALVVPITVLERPGPIAALGRAIWVLRVRFWRTVGITWLILIVLLGVSAGLSVVLDLAATITGPLAWLVVAASSVLLSIVQIPVLSFAALLVFLDARMLQEGYDLELRIDQLQTV